MASQPGKGGNVNAAGNPGLIRLTFALPVAAAPAAIPTLGEWALAGLSCLLAALGLRRMRRRSVRY